MKKAVVKFKNVRDCPFWCSGECLENLGGCNTDELALPPNNCPLPDCEE